jgi:hypothetical protein
VKVIDIACVACYRDCKNLQKEKIILS